jgi:hypothetical protein
MNERQLSFISVFNSYAGKQDPTCYEDIREQYLLFRDRVIAAFLQLKLDDITDEYTSEFYRNFVGLSDQAKCGIGFCAGAINSMELTEVFSKLYYGKKDDLKNVQEQYLAVFGQAPRQYQTIKIPCWHPDAPKPKLPVSSKSKKKRR